MDINGINYMDSQVNDREYGKKTTLDQQDFMNLLMKELSYQDPTNPMDNKEFAAQLTQFTSLERLDDINKTLTEVLAYQHSMQNATVANLIGKTVQSDGNQTYMDGVTEMTYELPEDAATVKITVRDQDGAVVWADDLVDQEAGSKSYVWNGKDFFGNQLAKGSYSFEIEATNVDGDMLEAITKSQGTVTDVMFRDGVTSLVLDGTRNVFLTDIQSISL